MVFGCVVNSRATNFIKLAGVGTIEGNQQVATKPDESLSPSLFTVVRLLPAFIAISITFL